MIDWVKAKDQTPPANKPVVVWNGELSIASFEDGTWFLQDEDGYVYERVRCGSGCCWTEEKKKLFYGPSHWMDPDIPDD